MPDAGPLFTAGLIFSALAFAAVVELVAAEKLRKWQPPGPTITASLVVYGSALLGTVLLRGQGWQVGAGRAGLGHERRGAPGAAGLYGRRSVVTDDQRPINAVRFSLGCLVYSHDPRQYTHPRLAVRGIFAPVPDPPDLAGRQL